MHSAFQGLFQAILLLTLLLVPGRLAAQGLQGAYWPKRRRTCRVPGTAGEIFPASQACASYSRRTSATSAIASASLSSVAQRRASSR